MKWVLLLLRTTASLVWPLLSASWSEKTSKAISAKSRHSTGRTSHPLHSHKHLEDFIGVYLHALASSVHVELHSAAWEATHSTHATHARVDIFSIGTQIVLPALLWVTKNCVRLAHIFEHFFGLSFLFVRLVVLVRMPLKRKFAICVLDIFFSCCLFYSQDLIIVLLLRLLN